MCGAQFNVNNLKIKTTLERETSKYNNSTSCVIHDTVYESFISKAEAFMCTISIVWNERNHLIEFNLFVYSEV